MSFVKAIIVNTFTGEHIPVMFNPESYSISKNNSFSEQSTAQSDKPKIEFSGSLTADTLSMDLFFDTYEAGIDVRVFTGRISNLMKPVLVPGTENSFAPPVCIFTWGTLIFTCVFTNISINYDFFLSSGIPVRATMSISLKEYIDPDSSASKALSIISNVVQYTTISGETLSHVAKKTYNNPKEWRKIAEANNIDNPRNLEPGQQLTIPN